MNIWSFLTILVCVALVMYIGDTIHDIITLHIRVKYKVKKKKKKGKYWDDPSYGNGGGEWVTYEYEDYEI